VYPPERQNSSPPSSKGEAQRASSKAQDLLLVPGRFPRAGADLSGANLVETNLERSTLTGCKIYGISAWNLKLNGAKQKDIVTPDDEPAIISKQTKTYMTKILNKDQI
jgi:hypothetical protein